MSRVIFSIVILLGLAGCIGTAPVIKGNPNAVRENLGIETIAMRQTAAGNMLDFRFRVLEPSKSMPLFQKDIRPYLIDEKTGTTLKVTDTTKVGPMRPTSRNPKAGKTYFMFFGNPSKSIKPGDRVTVVVGSHRLENILVQ